MLLSKPDEFGPFRLDPTQRLLLRAEEHIQLPPRSLTFCCYEKFTDIFTVQDAISERVAAALAVKLGSNATRQLRKRYTENTDAYQAYLRGRYFWGNRGAENLKKAVEEFNQAIVLDDKYAFAFAGLADCYNVLPAYGGLSPVEAYPKARAAATKALEIDDTIAEAHTALARIKANYDWDWPGAEVEFKRAIEFNPNYSSQAVIRDRIRVPTDV